MNSVHHDIHIYSPWPVKVAITQLYRDTKIYTRLILKNYNSHGYVNFYTIQCSVIFLRKTFPAPCKWTRCRAVALPYVGSL